jgi:hypothetical protein
LISETGGVGSVIPIAKLDDTSNINFGYTLNSTYINNIPFTGNRGDLYTIYSSGARKILSLDFNCLAVDTVGNLFKRSSFIATGKTHEVLIYPSGQTGNRELIEDNINNAFSIYGGWEATVETWYDQSGNGNDASQSDTNAQPTIASGGVVIRENGKPAVQFNGSSSTLKTANLTATAQPTTHFIALKRANTTAGNWYAVDSRTTNQIIGTLSTNAAIYGGAFLTGGALTANQELQSALFNSTSSLLYRNGTQEASGNAGTSSWTGVTLGSFNNEAQSFYSGSIQEYIVYTSNQSDNRPLIEKSINSYYNIYAQDAAIQNVATAQPKIYDGATGVMTENGKLAVQFDSTDDRFVLSTIQATVSNYEIFAVSNSTSTNTSWFFDARSGRLILDAQSTVFSGSGDAYYDGVNNIGNKFTDNIQSIKTWILDSTGNNSAAVYQNGTLWAGSLPYTQKAIDGIIRLGDSSFDNRSWGGRLQELVFYATNPTGNRIDIENNINSAFQIYAANFSSVLDTVPLAKAAYSIRRLTKNYIGPIITVTNGSTTKDFYADFWGNLNVAAIVDHVNGGSYDITKWWDQSGKGNHLESSSNHPTLNISNNQITGITVNSTNSFDNDLNNIAESINASSFPERTDYLLDDYSGAAAAYSLRKIREGYTGPLVRVRRDGGDNAEVDVYPDSNGTISISSSVIDVTEITGTNSSVTSTETTFGDFITGFDGKVVVWYDQSSDFTSDWYTVPNSQNNAVQEVSGSQPKIYDSSTGVTTKDGASSVFFDGVDDGFEMSLGGISVFDNFIVNSSDDFRAIWAYDGSSNYAWFAQNGSTSSPISNYGSPTLYKNGAQITIGTATDLYNDIRTGGLLLLSDLGGSTSSWASYRIADRSLSSQQWSGFVCEMIFYSSDQSTNRTGIETNINDYYSIYPNTNKLVAVYDNSIQRTIALNSASYTDLKEIIHYE